MIRGFKFDVPDVCDELENMLGQENQSYDVTQNIGKMFKKSKNQTENEDLEQDAKPDNLEDQTEAIQVAHKIDHYLEQNDTIDKNQDQTEIIRSRIENSFIPALFKHLTDRNRNRQKKEEDLKIRIYVAVCIVRLLRKTSTKYFNNNLNKLIKTIVVSLKSKMISIRDMARDALTQVNLNLSPYLLHITIDQMFKTLVKGQQRHIRSYTTHHILENLVKEGVLKVGQIDHCLGKYKATDQITRLSVTKYEQAILKIVMDDLFSSISVEKQLGLGEIAVHYSHTKESKANRTLASFEIIARFINFDRSFINLIGPVVKKVEQSATPTEFKK